MSLSSVLTSTRKVSHLSTHVKILENVIENEVRNNSTSYIKYNHDSLTWASNIHFYDINRPDLTAQYIFVLDTLNFCFWPVNKPTVSYSSLATILKDLVLKEETSISSDSLSKMDLHTLKNKWGLSEFPLLEERCRLLVELGTVLVTNFNGSVSNFITQAEHKADIFIKMITSYFPGFRDSSIYRGEQIFFYKRAQILVADLWGAFSGKSLGYFEDIHSITCFADYRLPQILRSKGILKFSKVLSDTIENQKEIIPGSVEEQEIRSCTIQAVDIMVKKIQLFSNNKITAVEVDWVLWNLAEKETTIKDYPKHHRVLTPFY